MAGVSGGPRVDDRSHYEVQRDRRQTFIERWREQRQEVIRPSDVKVAAIAPGVSKGHYLGSEAGRPTRLIDCAVHRLDSGAVSVAHRHSWDVVMFVVSGTGWTEIEGRRFAWRPWDAVHLRSWAAHRHGTDDPRGAEFLTFSSEPVFESLGAAWMLAPEEPAPTGGVWPAGSDGALDSRADRLAAVAQAARDGRVHTDYDQIPLRANAKGTRSKFLVDPSIGSVTSGLTMVMTQYGPRLWQAKHRHPGEALLYVVDGRGHSYFGEEFTGGREYAWQAGDLLIVDHFLWHQHFNDDPNRPARLLRVHLMETMLTTMQALLDPLPLLEEPAEELARAPDAADAAWPADERPE